MKTSVHSTGLKVPAQVQAWLAHLVSAGHPTPKSATSFVAPVVFWRGSVPLHTDVHEGAEDYTIHGLVLQSEGHFLVAEDNPYHSIHLSPGDVYFIDPKTRHGTDCHTEAGLLVSTVVITPRIPTVSPKEVGRSLLWDTIKASIDYPVIPNHPVGGAS